MQNGLVSSGNFWNNTKLVNGAVGKQQMEWRNPAAKEKTLPSVAPSDTGPGPVLAAKATCHVGASAVPEPTPPRVTPPHQLVRGRGRGRGAARGGGARPDHLQPQPVLVKFVQGQPLLGPRLVPK
jgi:hypothetical protein